MIVDGGGVAREEVRETGRVKKEGLKRGEQGSLTSAAVPLLHGNRAERKGSTYPPQVRLFLGRSQRLIPRQMAHMHRPDHF